MKIEILKNYEEVLDRAFEIVSQAVRKNPDVVLGLPTGETPIGLYDRLSEACRDHRLSLAGVTTFNLDEYLPIRPENEQSYRCFMNKMLFLNTDIPLSQTHVPEGDAADPELAARRYEQAIRDAGGIDLQVLGSGRNGHVGFNEPGTSFDSETHTVSLTESTIDANARLFHDRSEVPTRAVTMGIGTILRARSILLLVTGKEKHEALGALLSGKETEEWPLTALLRHDDVTVLCDQDAFGG